MPDLITLSPLDLPEGLTQLPPTQDDLPCCDGIPMETQRHKLQMDLLIDALRGWLQVHRADSFVSGNMFVYFSLAQVENRDYRGPDFFVALDVSAEERRSWVAWAEGKCPDVVIELLSDSTAHEDKTTKFQSYQNQMRVPEYFWYDPFNPADFAGFTLQNAHYQAIAPDSEGNLVSATLGLQFLRWTGHYHGVTATWLRWASLEGQLLPTGDERAEQQTQLAEQQTQLAEQQAQRADRLAQKLRELGVDPDGI